MDAKYWCWILYNNWKVVYIYKYKIIMKLNLTEQELFDYFKEAFEPSLLNEELSSSDKNDIKSMVKKEIKDFLTLSRSIDFEKKVETIIKNKIKSDKDVEKYIVDVTRNVLVQLYKNLWLRRNFWSNDLKNLPS